MLNPLRSLPGGRNTIALLGGFLLAFVIWWLWPSKPKANAPGAAFSPASELDRIAYAVQNARSWRTTTLGTMHGQPFQTDQDVVCPSDSHTLTRVTTAPGTTTVAEEFIETKGVFYAREGNDPWASQPRPGGDPCTRGPMAGPATLLATLDTIKSTGRLRQGNLVQFPGGACRVWEIVASNGLSGIICVDEATRLPYELRYGALRVQYSNWNLPAAIVPPQMPNTIRGMVPGVSPPK
jgi:hypothetical protein